MNLREIGLQMMLQYRSRPGRIHRRLRRRGFRHKARTPQVGVVRAAAVQLEFHLCETADEYVDLIYERVRRAVAEGAELIAFPEDTASLIVGIIPGIGPLLRTLTVEEALKQVGDGVQVADLFRILGRATRRIYETTFRTLAIGFGVHIAAGSAMLPAADARMLNVGYVFTPEGDILRQAKCHLLPMEVDWGLAPGEDLEVYDTSVGRIGLPVCMDATYFETFRILRLQGAEIVLVPIADAEYPYNRWKALRGIWPRVQESQVFGVQAALVGNVLGMRLTGNAGIYAPLAMTPNGDGILAISSEPEGETIVVADMDIAALQSYRQENPLDLNPALYEHYFPRVYSGFWRGGAS
ncbi:MAG: nitrilase [Thermaerobacter sp.]|nr:nitrilase [Thermaerobacter sp.]